MYNFEILHIPGKLNPAHPASRRPDYDDGKSHSERVILLGRRHLIISHIHSLFPASVYSVSFVTSSTTADPFVLHCLQELYVYNAALSGRPSSLLNFVENLSLDLIL